MIAAAVGLVLSVGGCGQLTVGEQSPATTESGTVPAPDLTPDPTPDLTPGPGATAGCEELAEPVHRLISGEGDTASTSAEVRRLADGVEDNALSAVASRLSGLLTQPVVDPVVVDAQWDQFRQLCDLP